MAERPDDRSRGLMDLPGTVCRHVHRPHQPWPHHRGVHDWRHVRSDDAGLLLAVHLWRHGDAHGAQCSRWRGHGWDLPSALYGTIFQVTTVHWLNGGMGVLATVLLATWFITSSDSGALVITTMLSMGSDNPPQRFRIVWGLGEGFGAAVLLLAGGLTALHTASIAAALPVSVIMLLMVFGVVKSLHSDPGAVAAPDETHAPDGTRTSQELHA